VHYQFGEEHVTLSLVELEESRLRQMAALLASQNETLRERGETRLKELAARLANSHARNAAERMDSELGAAKRRKADERKAKIEENAARKEVDPLTLISERQLRRIKKSKPAQIGADRSPDTAGAADRYARVFLQRSASLLETYMVEHPTLLTETEAAVYIGMSTAYLRMDRCRGHVGKRTSGPAYLKMGRVVKYDVRDLDAWLAAHRVNRASSRPAHRLLMGIEIRRFLGIDAFSAFFWQAACLPREILSSPRQTAS
jgi:hypothetical protein